MRDPYAKSLRVKPQQVIPDKRGKTLRQILDETIKQDLPHDMAWILKKLDEGEE